MMVRRLCRAICAPWLLLLTVALVAAQSVAPVNDPSPLRNGTEFYLLLNTAPNTMTILSILRPLTAEAGLNGATNINVTGSLVLTVPRGSTPATSLTSSDVAYISCESPNLSGVVEPSTVFRDAVSRNPAAIILYATDASHCSYTPAEDDDSPYSMVFTATSQPASERLEDRLRESSQGAPQILIAQSAGMDSTNSTNDPPGAAGPPSSGNVLGPSPSTAVAMIVLYSITGVITALFLIIIVTGAIRAHRHPERYGPRAGGNGRSRQSRAKGIARAMLDTLPIVKFGEKNEVNKPGPDVEMGENRERTDQTVVASTNNAPEAGMPVTGEQTQEVASGPTVISQDVPPTVVDSTGAAVVGTGVDEIRPTRADQVVAEEGQLGCSICTEDFVKGEDVRVLPCDHKYHPACVDPWLLNVSGTCPLCRIDLRPAPTQGEHSDTADDAHPTRDPAALTSRDGDEDGGRPRMSRFLELHLGLTPHAGPHERIAALRRLRDDNRDGSRSSSRRRSRLSGIIRDSIRRHSVRMDTPEQESETVAQDATQTVTAARPADAPH